MKVVMSSGHGLYVRGASGVLDEVDEARKVVNRTADYLRQTGVECTAYHDDVSRSQSENLQRIVDFHNAQTRDLDVSVHFNAYENTDKPMGTECLYLTQSKLADEVSLSIANAGQLVNRGPKERTDLFFLNETESPAILIETCFVDSSADAETYRTNFDAICRSIATAISGRNIDERPPQRPPIEPPPVELPIEPPIEPPPPPSSSNRPTIRQGDEGYHVATVQTCLEIEIDGDFGSLTDDAVRDYQRRVGLDVDGVVGPDTWAYLERDFDLPPYPPPMTSPLPPDLIEQIIAIAEASDIAVYQWQDRGDASVGYINGMAVAFAYVVTKFRDRDPVALEMSKANTGDEDADALAWYDDIFQSFDMSNERMGIDVLRHLWVLMIGLGMRESSGRHCEGRDMSADNVESMTAEAGLFQMSWNASSCSDLMQVLMDQYSSEPPQCALSVFSEDVSCSDNDWSCYGNGDGMKYQLMAKVCPQFACETAAIGLRNLRQHWGPINRKEAEVRPEADDMLRQVQDLVIASV